MPYATKPKVITNNRPRGVIDGWELTQKEREEFDYIDWKGIEEGSESASFFRYQGQLYHLSEFERVSDAVRDQFDVEWDGVQTDSFFSGILVRYVENFERVIVGRYTC